jgi:hypothetical protein
MLCVVRMKCNNTANNSAKDCDVDEGKISELETRCAHIEAILRIKKQINALNVFR